MNIYNSNLLQQLPSLSLNKTMKIIGMLLFLLALPTLLQAQKHSKNLERANNLFDEYSYIQAIQVYEKILKKNSIPEAYLKLAESYRLTRRMDLSLLNYRKAAEANTIDSIYLYHFASVLKYNQQYEEAKKWYLKYEDYKQDGMGKKQAKFIELIHFFTRDSSKVEIKNLAFNSEYADFSPAFFKDGLIFSSTRTKGKNTGGLDQWTGENYNDIYFIEKINIDSTSKAKILKGFINSNYHEGPASYNPTDDIIYFTRNSIDKKGIQKRSKEGILKIQIYTAQETMLRWDIIQNFELNNPNYIYSHPSITHNGKRLYFASDMAGGYGGLDIYYTDKIDSTWSPPINLGPQVNTQWNEAFPYVHSTGTLYFASDGLPGLGGFDVYSVRFNGLNWDDVKNLGYPINTSFDDFGFIIDQTNKSGYISSNRNGGKGSDDIFSVYIKDTYFEEGVLLSIEEDASSENFSQLESNDYDLFENNVEPLLPLENKIDTSNIDSSKHKIANLSVLSLSEEMEDNLISKVAVPDYEKEAELAQKVMIPESNEIPPTQNSLASNKKNIPANTKAENHLNATTPPINIKSKTEKTLDETNKIKKDNKILTDAKSQKKDVSLDNLQQELDYKKVSGLTFKIQVGAFKSRLKKNPDDVFKIEGIETYSMDDKMTRYTTPYVFYTLSEAKKHQKTIREKGIKDAWIVPFYQQQRITIQDALEKLKTK